MLVDLKKKRNELRVRELLTYTTYEDDNPSVDQLLKKYDDPNVQMAGIENEGALIGLAGYKLDQNQVLQIIHMIVHPSMRGLGYGRGLLLELIHLHEPVKIVVETDEEAVEFFRNIGFEIISLGINATGAERYKCIYDVLLSEDDEYETD